MKRFTSMWKGNTQTVVIAVVLSLVVGSTSAIAAQLITGSDIKNGTIKSLDIKNSGIRMVDLNRKIRSQLNRPAAAGTPGSDGTNGATGATGANGTNGATGATGANGTNGATGATGATGTTGADGQDAVVTVSSIDGSPADPEAWSSDEFSFDEDAPFGEVSIAPAAGAGSLGAEAVRFDIPNDSNAYANIATSRYDGVQLKDLTTLRYSERWDNGTDGSAAPYLFIRIQGGHIVSFRPLYQTEPTIEGAWQRWDVTEGLVSYDNTAGPDDMTWDELIAAHGDEVILGSTFGGGIRFYGGSGTAASAGSTLYLDAVEIEAAGQQRLYDFEQ